MSHINPFGHLDLRVDDMAAALRFYSALLPALGFTEEAHGEQWKVWAAPGTPPDEAYVGVAEQPGHVANGNRVAFWAATPGDVDRVAAVAVAAGAWVESGPRPCPEYSESYYAVFFADPSGNRFEVYHRTD